MKLKTALNKSKLVYVLVQLNQIDSIQLMITKTQARDILDGYLEMKDEFEEGRFEDKSIIAEYDSSWGTLWIG